MLHFLLMLQLFFQVNPMYIIYFMHSHTLVFLLRLKVYSLQIIFLSAGSFRHICWFNKRFYSPLNMRVSCREKQS